MSRYHVSVLTVYFAWSFNVRIAPGAKANVTQAVPSNLWDVVLPKGGSRLTVDLRWCICIGYQAVPSYNRLLDSASNPNLNYWSVLKFPGCFSVRSKSGRGIFFLNSFFPGTTYLRSWDASTPATSPSILFLKGYPLSLNFRISLLILVVYFLKVQSFCHLGIKKTGTLHRWYIF